MQQAPFLQMPTPTPQGFGYAQPNSPRVVAGRAPSRPSTPAPDIRKLYGLQSPQPQAPQPVLPRQLSPPQLVLSQEQLQQNFAQRAFGQQVFEQSKQNPFLSRLLGGAPAASPAPMLPPRGPGLLPALEPSQLVKGQAVDYWSQYNSCWIPATITDVDSETGGIFLNVKQSVPITLREQRKKIRAHTRPTKEQVSAAQAIVQDGKVESTAEALFARIAGSQGGAIVPEQVPGLGGHLDSVLGLVGCQIHMMHLARQERGMTLDQFKTVFWELIQTQQEISVQAIPRFSIESCIEGEPWTRYDKGKKLGEGTYGLVNQATDKQSKQVRAIKEISSKKVAGSIQSMKKEINNLTQLDHPHILKLYEVYHTFDAIYLVTDICSGGELRDVLRATYDKGGVIPENWIASLMLQLIQAISHIHVRGIIHLDLKSTNMMLMPSQKTKMFFQKDCQSASVQNGFAEQPHLMVIDLGIAMHFKPGDFRGNRPMGTPSTMAPEVWRGEITPDADVFSSGCVFFELLTGDMPFNVPRFNGDYEELATFWRKRPQVDFGKLRKRSPEAVSLVKGMIHQDRQQRATASQCLACSFLQGASQKQLGSTGARDPAARSRLMQRLGSVHRRSILYKSIALTIAQDWPPNQMPSFKKLFNELDVLGNGSLQTASLAEALCKHGIDKTEAQLATSAMNLSQDKSTVDWTEFVAACIDLSQQDFQEKIFYIFQSADEDKDNLLSPADLGKMFRQGHKYSSEVVATVFRDLTGRDAAENSGARMDWDTFYSHLQKCARDGMADADSLDASRKDSSLPSLLKQSSREMKEKWGVLADVFDGISNAINPLFSNTSSAPQKPSETAPFPGAQIPKSMDEKLKVLHDMGFADRKLNEKIILENGGELTDAVFEALMTRCQ